MKKSKKLNFRRKSIKRKSIKRKSTKMFSIRKKHCMKGGVRVAILTEDDKEQINKNEQVKPWMKNEIKAGMGIEHHNENEFRVHVREAYTISIYKDSNPKAYELFLTIYNNADVYKDIEIYKVPARALQVNYSDQGGITDAEKVSRAKEELRQDSRAKEELRQELLSQGTRRWRV